MELLSQFKESVRTMDGPELETNIIKLLGLIDDLERLPSQKKAASFYLTAKHLIDIPLVATTAG